MDIPVKSFTDGFPSVNVAPCDYIRCTDPVGRIFYKVYLYLLINADDFSVHSFLDRSSCAENLAFSKDCDVHLVPYTLTISCTEFSFPDLFHRISSYESNIKSDV